jgi:hypothetical protein
MMYLILMKSEAHYLDSIVPQRKQSVSTTKINSLILFRKIIAFYCENHTKHTNTLCGQNVEVEVLNVKAGGTYTYECALKC